MESSGRSGAGLASPGRLVPVSALDCLLSETGTGLTVQRSVHPAHIDQQADHGHVDGGGPLRQQLVLEDLTALAAARHGVQVDVGKRVQIAARAIGELVEDALLVGKDEAQEVVLDVFSPQGDAVVLLQMADLVPGVDGRDAPIRITARARDDCGEVAPGVGVIFAIGGCL